ncbi:MAG: cupin domain-containing protein, partial [Natronospirillum sp.]
DVALDLSFTELPSGETAGMADFSTEGSAMLLVLEPGGFEDWHPSPDPIMLVVKEGQSEVQVTDGEVRIFGPGDIVIMEDTGKGHTTRTVGDERHVALLIPLSPDY